MNQKIALCNRNFVPGYYLLYIKCLCCKITENCHYPFQTLLFYPENYDKFCSWIEFIISYIEMFVKEFLKNGHFFLQTLLLSVLYNPM